MKRWMLALASLKFTPFGLVLLAMATVAIYTFDHAAAPWLAVPLLALAVNLIASVATNGIFRRQMALLVFHLALIALVLLAAFGRLSYLKGQTEVLEGNTFSGLDRRDAGPLHSGGLERVRFINEGFEIVYMAGPVLDRNANRVRVLEDDGSSQLVEIESKKPLVRNGYRIYPTSNKGFAPVFAWHPTGKEAVLAAVHLPSYPVNAENQAQSFRPAGAAEDIWVMLEIDEVLIPEDRPSRFRLPERQKIVVRRGTLRAELLPGQRIALADGELEFRELRTWMGYQVFYDWTIVWLLAACVVAVLSLSWHFWRKFAARPWDHDSD